MCMMPDGHYLINIEGEDTVSQVDCYDTVFDFRIMEVHL